VNFMKSKRFLLVAAVFFLTISGISQSQNRASNTLIGTYRLNQTRSDNPSAVADRVSRNLPGERQQRLRDSVMRRLDAPDSLAIDVNGKVVTMASSTSVQVSFDADGRAKTEQSRNGRTQRTTASVTGNRLTVCTTGDRAQDYQATFDVIDSGRSLRVTRSITDENLNQRVVARSVYDKVSDQARWDFRDRDSNPGRGESSSIVPNGTVISAVLNDNLNTRQVTDGDRFTLTVQSPAQYNGAAIEGHVAQVNRSGQVAGRAGMALDFDRIRMRDGRAANLTDILRASGRRMANSSTSIMKEDSGMMTARPIAPSPVLAWVQRLAQSLAQLPEAVKVRQLALLWARVQAPDPYSCRAVTIWI